MKNNTQLVKKDLVQFVGRLGSVTQLAVRRMQALAAKTIADNPGLADCTITSLRRAFAACAISGLYPDGQEAAILPFRNAKTGKKEAVFCPGYRGLVRLAYEHPDISSVQMGVVYQGETLEVSYGIEPVFKYKPILNGSIPRDDEHVIAAWAMIVVRGEPIFLAMSREEIEKIRAGRNSDAWTQNYAAMAQKTVLKQLLGKRAPVLRQLSVAIIADDAAEAGEPQIIDAEVETLIMERPRLEEPWDKKQREEPEDDDFPFSGPRRGGER